MSSATTTEADLDPDQVLAYLKRHPELLEREPDLMSRLLQEGRFDDAKVVDMQSRLVSRLRGEMARLRSTADEIISTTRANLSSQTRTHAVVLAVLEATDLDQLLKVVGEDLPILVDVDAAVLAFEDMILPLAPVTSRLPQGAIDELMGGHVALLRHATTGQRLLYGPSADLIHSDALARLVVRGQQGILALGSRHADTFQTGQGTELFVFLARVIEIMLERLLGET
jgi:uncharacterized protein YigA (DUF484 family)